MNKCFIYLFLTTLITLNLKAEAPNKPNENDMNNSVTYEGGGGSGDWHNVVMIAGDHEYRTEECLPALAKMLAKHYGFKCTVLFTTSEEGFIEPGSSRMEGLEVLKDADLLVVGIRFQDFDDAQMQYIDDYLKRGGAVIGLRTSTHAFKIEADKKWAHYSNGYKESVNADWQGGFGRTILGEQWAGHYGKNHKQSSRLLLQENVIDHPVLLGVEKGWVQSGGYEANPAEGSIILARGEVLNGMTADSPADETKELMPVAWVRNYLNHTGSKGRVFTTTHGASEDILNEGFRRMLMNAALWCVGEESSISKSNDVSIVGPYKPSTFGFGTYKENVNPADLKGFDSLLLPGTNKVSPKKKSKKKKK